MFRNGRFGYFVIAVLAAVGMPLLAGEATANPSQRSGPTIPAAQPAAKFTAAKSPITFSLTSSMRHGNLVVLIDDVPVFNEEFQKPALLVSQTTTWDPVHVTTGKHKLKAKVYGANGKTYFSSVYNLDVRPKGIELRIRTKGEKVTVEPAS